MSGESSQRQPPGPDAPREQPPSNGATWIGGLIFILLVAAGIWLLNRIDDSKRAQECLESGRRNCRIIEPSR